jgi:hypothetical protein
MRVSLIGLVVLVGAIGFGPQLSGQAPPPTGPKVQITFEEGGTVSLVANGATLREILEEWTRKGGTPFVGADRLSGGPLTLQYQRRPETEVVGSLLRSASGVMMAPRLDASTGASQLQVVYVLATSSATPATSSYSTPVYNNPAPTQPMISSPGSPEVEIPPAAPGRTGEATPNAPPPTPSTAPRPGGVSGVAVPVVAMPPTPQTAPPPAGPGTPPPTTTGRGGGGGGR